MSNDKQQDYFAEGMMDEILNHLYKMGGVNVISRTSSMVYKESKKTSREIANELGVANLLEGSVQKNGDSIRVIVKLINGKTDAQLWGDSYDKEYSDVFVIQSDIAEKIASELKIKIDPGLKKRIEYVPTQNTDAYNLILQAANDIYVSKGTDHTRMMIEQAIALDSNFADAYAWLALY
jgi:TolB-like protein